MPNVRLLQGDVIEMLKSLPDASVDCVVTSPPYWGLRSYGVDGQLGLEAKPELYVAKLVAVFAEVWRVMKPSATLWLNLGDSYAREGGKTPGVPRHWDGRERDSGGIHNLRATAHDFGMKAKDLVGIPWRVAFALQAAGWWLRSDIIWSKPNPMPESVTDRPTKSHEYLFLLARAEQYYYDQEVVREPNSPYSGKWGKSVVTKTAQAQGNGRHGATGFMGREMTNDEVVDRYYSNGRNKRTVWHIATQPFNGSRFLADYEGADGRFYIASPDCPIHGQLARSRNPQTDGHGEQQDHQPSRTYSISIHPVQEQQPGCDPATPNHAGLDSLPSSSHEHTGGNIGQSKSDVAVPDMHEPETCHDIVHTQQIHGDTAGYSLQLDAETASDHNTQMSKTGHVLRISERDSASAQMAFGIHHTSPAAENTDSAGRSDVSNTSPDGTGGRLSVRTPSHNADKSSYPHGNIAKCTCQVVTVDHFATYPEALVLPCVLAGSSERGVCSNCGKPWARVVEDTHEYAAAKQQQDWKANRGKLVLTGNEFGRSKTLALTRSSITTGWRPSCTCGAPTKPATILDPFVGSGTTGVVACQQGRDFIGIDLNPDYIEMARKRIDPYRIQERLF